MDALADVPGALLVIVGEGEERGPLQRRVAQLGLEDRVRFVGARPPEEVAAYLAAGDVFLFPTERDEAAPVVLLEAMASGTPVVASELGGIPEVSGSPAVRGSSCDPAIAGRSGRQSESCWTTRHAASGWPRRRASACSAATPSST